MDSRATNACEHVCRYVDKKGLAAVLAAKRPAGVHTRDESKESITYRQESMEVKVPSWLWNPGQISPEVHNSSIYGPSKRIYVLHFFLKRHRIEDSVHYKVYIRNMKQGIQLRLLEHHLMTVESHSLTNWS